MPDDLDWAPVRALARRVRDGERLTLTDDVRELLERTASEVGISKADAASVPHRIVETPGWS